MIEAAMSNTFIISSDCPNGPEEFINNAKKLGLLNIKYIESPVSGGKEGAINGIMTAICSGDSVSFGYISNILNYFCTNIF